MTVEVMLYHLERQLLETVVPMLLEKTLERLARSGVGGQRGAGGGDVNGALNLTRGASILATWI